MLIIQASNIHTGGGAVLLGSLFKDLGGGKTQVRAFVDQRFPVEKSENPSIQITSVKPKVLSRLAVEFRLAGLAKTYPAATFLFFGNLPPLFRSSKKAILYFQNVILLEEGKKFKFSFFGRLKHSIERFWLWYGMPNVSVVFVQSDTVKKSFLKQFPEANVKVKAFTELISKMAGSEKRDAFVYVASSAPHKNHLNLLKAWNLLFDLGIRPKLILTASDFCGEEKVLFESSIKKGVNLEIRESLSHADVMNLFSNSTALIFPSLAESFGLPLLEAKQMDLPIIASELDYVRDLVSPAETFDPSSETSIVRAVQRFLNVAEVGRTEVKSSTEFLTELMSE